MWSGVHKGPGADAARSCARSMGSGGGCSGCGGWHACSAWAPPGGGGAAKADRLSCHVALDWDGLASTPRGSTMASAPL